MENGREEVDLIDLFTTLIRKIVKRKFLFMGIIILFMGGALLYSVRKKPTYKTELLAKSFIEQEACVKIFSDFNEENLRTQSLFPHVLLLGAEKGSKNTHTLELSLVLDDTTQFRELVMRIEQKFSLVPYVKEKMENRTKDLQSLIEIYEEGIRENHKKELALLNSSAPRTVILNGTQTSLRVRKMDLEQQLQELTPIKIVATGYFPFERHKGTLLGFLKITLLGIIIAISVVALKKDV